MVYQQAALAVDGRNYPAANELGNILTTFGQLPEARRILLHSVGTIPNPEGWHNLAAVHDRLGETELGAHARKQVELLTGGTAVPRPKVEWVSPEVFAGNPPAAAAKAAAASTTAKSEQRTADTRPKQKETWLSPFGVKR
jgi:predicted Zn-dependent protease